MKSNWNAALGGLTVLLISYSGRSGSRHRTRMPAFIGRFERQSLQGGIRTVLAEQGSVSGWRAGCWLERRWAALEPGLRCCRYQPMPDALWSENCGRMLGTDSWEDASARQCCPNYFLQEGAAVLYCWEAFGAASWGDCQLCSQSSFPHGQEPASSSTGAGKGARRTLALPGRDFKNPMHHIQAS